VSVYIHQLQESGLGQKVCQSKNIPIFKTVAEALTLSGPSFAVDGVVLVGEHGVDHNSLNGQKDHPRWWLHQQVIRVFEQSKRSVPDFNDKQLTTRRNEAKWMFGKSRKLNFPLFGGSSLPFYFGQPEIELPLETLIQHSLVAGGAGDEGSLSWVERTPWAAKLLGSTHTEFSLAPGPLENSVRNPLVCIVDYRDGIRAAAINAQDVGWTYAGAIAGQPNPGIISMLGHWLVEMMLTRKEPYNAARLLLSTGIVSYNMESNWENGRYSAVGRRVETPFMNIAYRPTRGPQFNTGARPPVLPYIRGFEK
jgi:hypothetical protein